MARLRALAAHCSGNGHGVRGRWAIVNRMEIFGDTLMFGSVRSAPDDIDLGDLEVKTGQDAIFAISEVMERQRREVEERRAREEGRCSEPRRDVAPTASRPSVHRRSGCVVSCVLLCFRA